MKYVLYTMLMGVTLSPMLIFDFTTQSNIQDWVITDDIVMGGESSGTFILDAEGNGIFSGKVSLENNGGFSSVRYRFNKLDVTPYTKIKIKLRGDGKKYEFRIKTNSSDYYSYIYTFSTTGAWQDIEIPLKDMYPSFRGRKLNQPNFANAYIQEIGILIGNKKEENFKLILDKIELQ